MRWRPGSVYDLPSAILEGLSDSAFSWQEEGHLRSGPQPVRIFFSCKEPKPPYAEELIRELQLRVGASYRSHFLESSPVSVIEHVEDADAVVTFYDHLKPNDEGLHYDVMIPGAPEMGGWFCDDDKYYGGCPT